MLKKIVYSCIQWRIWMFSLFCVREYTLNYVQQQKSDISFQNSYWHNYVLVSGAEWAETIHIVLAPVSPKMWKYLHMSPPRRKGSKQSLGLCYCCSMFHRALECKMKNGSGVVKAHFIAMATSSACSSVVLGSRVSNGLNGCECKYSVSRQGVAGASLKGWGLFLNRKIWKIGVG